MKAGDKLGPYELVSPLGAGGMGEVWKARDTRLDRFVAIKTSKEAFNERFLQEARTIAKLDHPHICRLYDVGPDYLVMELLEGKPLGGPLPLRTVLTFAQEICSALHEAHRLGIVHRDLKPANIMATRNGISLLDFGLAKREPPVTADNDATILENTLPGQIVGTLHYMSPEQLQGKQVDARSDIFSLGLVMYEMLTGKRAVTAEDPASVISQIMLGESPQFDLPAQQLPPALAALVHRCLEKKPEDRWQSTRDIEWVLQSIQSAPQAVATVAPTKPGWKAMVPSAAIFAMLAVLVGAGGWLWLRSRPAEIPAWRVRPLTAYAGIESMPALSPDGKLVAFVWNGDQRDNFDIYVKPIGDETLPLRITSDPAADSAPAWSPDGDRLAFLRKAGNGANLMIASSHGGGERIIASISTIRSVEDLEKLSWSPDGRYVAFANGSILRANWETREVKSVTGKPPADSYDSMPAYAPDGSSLAFARGTTASRRILYLQKLDRHDEPIGEPAPIMSEAQGLKGVAWWPQRKSLIVSFGIIGSFMEAVRVPIDGGVSQHVPFDASSVLHPSYNPFVGRLVYQREWLDMNILRASLGSPNASPEPIVTSSHLDMSLDVAPDGQRIVFASSRTGQMGIWRADRDGANQILLAASSEEHFGVPRWTPDGKSVVFSGGRAGISSLYIVSSEGGKPEKLPGAQLSRPSVSPDGRWIYHERASSGRPEVWKMPIGGGPQTQVTREGGTDALSSGEGSSVFYYRDGEIRRVASTGGLESTVTTGVRRGKWTVSGDKVYVIRDRGQRSAVMEMNSDGGNERIVYEIPFPITDTQPVSSIGVSARTGEIFIQHQARIESDLMLVEGFR